MKEFEWKYDEVAKQLTLHTRQGILEEASKLLVDNLEIDKGSHTIHYSLPNISGVIMMDANNYMISFTIAELFNNKKDIERIKKEVEDILDLNNNTNLIITSTGVRRL